nr:disease resistance protein RPM1-like [Coffea arabica]
MALTILSSVLNQLSILLREEGHEVEFIGDELGHMRAFLRVAETKEEGADPRLQEWIKQVREAAYDIEDVLDEFMALFARHPATGFHGSVRTIFNSIKTLRARHNVAEQLQSIKARVKNISEGHRRYQSEFGVTIQAAESLAAVNNTTWRYSRDDALLVEEAELVGIDNPKQQLISQLFEGDDSQLKVVSVVGMGGLGKTTLVKKVHEDLDVRRHFPVRAFVTVSQTCNFQELHKDLARQLHNELKKPVPESIEAMTAIQLKQFVKDFLQQAGRYAIVFDDVWDTEFWNAIRITLPKNGYGNRVMLTTRKADVAFASCTQSQDYVFRMVPLSFEDSWTLFCNKIFKGNGCPAHLTDVAKGILGKCQGLPLAIVAISGLLVLKDLTIAEEWEMVRRSLVGELEGAGMLDRVRKILSLSYIDLPCHLKTCLLYLSIYPEDFEIRCHRLVQLWSAEGFVGKTEGMTMTDVGFNYLRELVNRSLIQVTKSFYEGIPYTCRIHDLVREVVLSKSREQYMITITSGQCTRWSSEKVLDLSDEETLEEIPNEIFNLYPWFAIAGRGRIAVSVVSHPSRHIGISNLRREDGKVLCSSLATLTSLQLLNIASIRNDGGDYEVMDLNLVQQQSRSSSVSSSFLQSLRMLVLHGPLEKMAKWIAHLQSLVRIYLKWSGLRDEEDPLEPLHYLPNLVTIHFCGSYQGEGLCFKAGGFLKLKDLHLQKLEKLKWLKVEEDALPNLHELGLDRLPLLEELPVDIQHLGHLQKLALLGLSYQLMEKLNNLNEDSEHYGKIARIPEVEIAFLTNEGWKYCQLWGKKM